MKKEMVDIVDENDNVIDIISRNECDIKELRRRVSIVIVLDSKKNILIQKRSLNKKIDPDVWDFGIAETLNSKENYEQAAIRGLKEEMNIETKKIPKFLFKLKYDNKKIKRFYSVYFLIYDGKINFQKEEIFDAKFVSVKDLKNLMNKERFSNIGLMCYNKYLEEHYG